ncbi:MAG: hypothetical protein MUF18_02370 [Fimbriiglobus sp.]|jgi:hypothetical protein|nr:hypothetical protein [Fimbriiglobus sp.]
MNLSSLVNSLAPTVAADLSLWAVVLIAGAVLAALTIWTYRSHPNASRRRLTLLVALRLLALLLVLFTACRPSWKTEERPNVPSRLLIAVDLSRSMTVTDEAGGLSRIDAVRRYLERCQPSLDELERKNCKVELFAFGPSEFTPATSRYDPTTPAAGERSDYAVFPRRLSQEFASDKFVRGFIVIGDGADNGGGRVDGKPLTPADAVAEWKARGVPVHTFAVGDQGTNQSAKDVAFADVILDPDPVAVKNKFVVRARVNAFKSSPLSAPFTVSFDTGDGKGYVVRQTTQVTLSKETNNLLEVPVDAPPELPKDGQGAERRQIKVRVEIPPAACPGDTNHANNAVETYLNLNKEGLRVLVVDRFGYEYARALDALAADKRIDVRKVDLQTDLGGEGLTTVFDFDRQAYDVLVLGNVTPKQLRAVDPTLPERIAERVKKGMGFLMIGGYATLNGSNGSWGREQGWRAEKAIADLLPVVLPEPDPEPDPPAKYMVVPEPQFADAYLTKVGDTREGSLARWEQLNTPANNSRFTGLNRVRAKQGASVFLWAKRSETLPDLRNPAAADKQDPLLVGQQLATGTGGRVLVMAAQNTFLWERLGQPKRDDGKQIHSRFWRQMVLWLAKQDQEEANAFVRPEFPRLKVADPQGLRVGLRGPNGAAVGEPKFTLRITGPGLLEAGVVVPVGQAADGAPRAEFVPRQAGEFTATLTASGRGEKDAEVSGTATAKFLVVPDTSEEMQRTTPDYDLLRSMATAGGGTFHRVEDLPAFLAELASQEYITVQPTRKNLPDWRPTPTNPFPPVWVAAFALVLAAEWGLRRWWGLV